MRTKSRMLSTHPSATAFATSSVKTSLPSTSCTTYPFHCWCIAEEGTSKADFQFSKHLLPPGFPKELPPPMDTFPGSPLSDKNEWKMASIPGLLLKQVIDILILHKELIRKQNLFWHVSSPLSENELFKTKEMKVALGLQPIMLRIFSAQTICEEFVHQHHHLHKREKAWKIITLVGKGNQSVWKKY